MPVHTPSEKKKNKAISRKISKLRGEGKSQSQSVAQAINTVAPERRKKRSGKRKGPTFT